MVTLMEVVKADMKEQVPVVMVLDKEVALVEEEEDEDDFLAQIENSFN